MLRNPAKDADELEMSTFEWLPAAWCDCNQPGVARHPLGHHAFCHRPEWMVQLGLRMPWLSKYVLRLPIQVA